MNRQAFGQLPFPRCFARRVRTPLTATHRLPPHKDGSHSPEAARQAQLFASIIARTFG